MGKIKDLTGMKFGRLSVAGFEGSSHGTTFWLCKCDCGNTVTVKGSSLRIGGTRSCGCLFKEIHARRLSKHGESHTRLHNVWSGMLQRCNDSKSGEYHRYGGRGIKVCEEWLSYVNFRDWALANGYDKDAPPRECTLDRIDNDGNYEPNNCRWVSMREQSLNKSGLHLVTYRGVTMTLTQWSEKTGIKRHTLLYRLKAGWDLDRAFTQKPPDVVPDRK